MRARGGASAALDALGRGAELVRALPGWSALLVATALPVRLLTAYLIWQVWLLGDEARHHGDALTGLALLALAAWTVSLLGRHWFVRACRSHADGGRVSVRGVLRVPPADLLAHLYLALLLELLFWALLPILLAAWVLIALAALAVSAVAGSGGGLVAPLRALITVYRPLPVLVLNLGFTCALALAFFNLHFAAQAGLWLAGGAGGIDLVQWHALLDLSRPLYVIQLLAGSTLVLEPFWIAAMTVSALQARARRDGEDLRQWFGELARHEGAP